MKRKFKKLFLLLAVIATAVVCFAFSASAKTVPASGKCGNNVTYTYNSSTRELIISGTGPMWDYEEGDSPFCNSNIKSVVINDGVTTIGENAFAGDSSGESRLTKVTIPDSVTTIGDYAFYYCYSLTDITVDENNQYFSNDEYGVLFNKDKTTLIQYPKGNKRTSYTIPDSVTTISDCAFYRCLILTEVTIGDSVTTIGDRAFYDCDSLTDITVDENNQYFSNDEYGVLFNKDKTTLIQYPIGNKRTAYTIPDSVTTIGDDAFARCDSLKEVTIGDSVTTIGDYAFHSCDSLTEVIIPDSVTTIGYSAFKDCYNLTEVTIPDSVITIGDGAFSYCDSLMKVTIPDSVTTIGVSAFYECYSLTKVYYSGTQEQWKKIKIGSGNGDLTGANIHYNSCKHIESTVQPQQDATCTANGYTAGVYCPDCKKWLSGHSTISAKGHTYTEKIIDSAHFKVKATVASPAIYKYDCANCNTISPDKTFTHGKALNLGTTSSVTATQTTSSLTLTWSKAENATGYRLYYKLPGDISWRNALTYTVATEHTFENLPAGQKYRFAVRSAYKKADGSYIRGGYKEIETATKTVKPSNVSATQNTSAIKLTWSASKGADGYRIYYKSGGKWTTLKSSTTATSYTIKNLKAGTKYTFAVKPYIKTDSGNVWSAYTQFTTATKPANPTLKVTAPSKGKLTVNWKAVSGAESYQLWYKTGNGSYKLYKTYTKAGTLNFKNLKSGTKYTFAVRAVIKTDGGNVRSGYKAVSVTVK